MDPDLLTEEVLRDPYPTLRAMREHDPVLWSDTHRGWMVTGYEECAAAHTDERISSDRIEPVLRQLERAGGDERLAATLRVLAGWMVFKDGAEHRRLRTLVQRSFTPRTVARLHERVIALTDELLDEMGLRAPTSRTPDLVAELAAPLPAAVIADMLGAPATDRDRFRHWSEDIVSLVFGAQGDEGRHGRAIAGMADLVAYLDDLIATKREAPGEDLVSLTLRTGPDGDALSHDEVVAMCTLLLFGGSETTTNLIGSGVLALMRDGEQRAVLLEDVEARAGGAIEELLRLEGPARMSVRIAGADLELGGKALRAGDRIYLVLAAANRDPARFDDPDALDITRDPNPHLGFGVGRHYCLGASLARLEGTVVIPRVLERLGEDARPAVDDLAYNPLLISRSLVALPLAGAGG